MKQTANVLHAYADTPAAKARNSIGRHNGQQPGDPAKAALAIITALEAPEAPLRLVLGADGLAMVRGKHEGVLKQLPSGSRCR
jgi:hypothetical protein